MKSGSDDPLFIDQPENQLAAEVGFEPTKLLFQRQVTLPIRLLGNKWLPQ
jgi:hypothetical protein